MCVLFWAAVFFVLYTYLGYPALMYGLSRSRVWVESPRMTLQDWPALAIVIPVHNELKRVGKKLDNLRSLSYPGPKPRYVFVSDGSDDGCDQWLREQTDVQVISYPERRGKPSALNEAVAAIAEPVVVFTDARQMMSQEALIALVSRLMQPGIGAVSGELCHYDAATNTGKDVGLYWRYEKAIRKAESRYFSTAGVTGALYAIRREHYQPLPVDTILDDFEVPMRIVRQGYRSVLEPTAQIFDEVQEDSKGERARKQRTLAGNYQQFFRYPWLFLPNENPVWFQFICHKVFRLLVPYALVVCLLSSLVAPGWFYATAAIIQIIFYAVAGMGLTQPGWRKNRWISFACVFVELNWAAVAGLVIYLRGHAAVTWKRV